MANRSGYACMLAFLLLSSSAGASPESIGTYPSGLIQNPISKTTQTLIQLSYPKFNPTTRQSGELSKAGGKPLLVPSAISAPWGKRSKLWILFVQLIDELDENRYAQCDSSSGKYKGDQRAEISVFQEMTSGKYRRIAGPSPIEDLRIHPCGHVFDTMTFDLAPFQVTPNQKAFGIRTRFHYYGSGPGGGCRNSTSEDLHLFVLDRQRIQRILQTQMYSYENDDDCKANEKKMILRVLSSQTLGYFDLEKKCVATTCAPQRYNWNAGQYFER